MKFLYTALVCLLIGLASAAHSSAPVEVREYTALRKKLLTSLSIDTLKADAASYVGKVFEVRGSITGFSRNDNGCVWIITALDGSSYLLNANSDPVESPGVEIACLVKIGPGSKFSLSDVSLVAWTYDSDLRRLEEAWQRAAEAKAKAEAEKAAAAKAAQEQAQEVKTQQAAGATVSSEELVKTYKKAIKGFNSKLTDSQADTIARSILGFSYRYKLDPRLVCAVILAESNFKINATSHAGAQGLGQLMPSTAAGLGVNNAYDPVENIYGSARYIRSMLDRMSGNKDWSELTWYDLGLALAAYNAGPGAVKKHGGIPPYRETQNYVKKVTSIYKQLCGVK